LKICRLVTAFLWSLHEERGLRTVPGTKLPVRRARIEK
jgi:hypothetical protein